LLNRFKIPIVKHSINYNPAIDGLRGIAIILVVFFHFWPNIFSFGFVGVDIFFVLSGFLISTIIIKNLKNNTFSFRIFYRNRIRRIFPAMIIVLLFSLMLGYLFLFPDELKNLGLHIESSAFFYENFRLIHEIGYWDKASILKPLLHFWSLAIEEHFYLFLPLILWIIYKTSFLKKYLFYILIIFLFLFISLEFVLNLNKFYNSLSRFWEFFIGVIGAYIISNYFEKLNNFYHFKIGKIYIYQMIIVLFFLSLLLMIDINYYSFIRLFIIDIFTVLVLMYLFINSNFIVFNNRFLIFFGIISYSLYLWHYVLISFFTIFGVANNFINKILILLISILISFISYRYIEYYFRKQKSFRIAIFLTFILIIIGMLGKYIYIRKGFPHRSFLTVNKYLKDFERPLPANKNGIELVTKILGRKPINDYIKATSSDINHDFVLIIGDSHAEVSYEGLSILFKKNGYQSVLIANSGCPPYINGALGYSKKDLIKCQEKINNIYTFINKFFSHIKKIVFITRGPIYMYDRGFGSVDTKGGKELNYRFKQYYISSDKYNQKSIFFKVVDNTFKYLNTLNKHIYYILENPELGFLPKNCLERPFGIFPITCKISIETYLKRQIEYRNFIFNLSKKYKNIVILDPKNLFCDDKYCYAIRKGNMLYADDDHISITGSKILAKFFKKELLK